MVLGKRMVVGPGLFQAMSELVDRHVAAIGETLGPKAAPYKKTCGCGAKTTNSKDQTLHVFDVSRFDFHERWMRDGFVGWVGAGRLGAWIR